MSFEEIARPSRSGDEAAQMRRMRGELARMADETQDMIAETTRLLAATHAQLGRMGRLSEHLRVVTIPPALRRRAQQNDPRLPAGAASPAD